MFRIAVLAETESMRREIADQIARFCGERGVFPRIEQYPEQECFFSRAQNAAPTNAVIALSGVAGLNAVEHLRAFQPACRIIWCSDLDFSLQAFRLRTDYFILEPLTEESLRQGLTVWLEERNRIGRFKPV